MSYGCKICGKIEDTVRCGKCKKVRYCGPICQKIDWDKHNEICYQEKGKTISRVYQKKEPLKPCPICLEEEEDEGQCGMCLECGNVFCGFCNTPEKLGKMIKCPICRGEMNLGIEERLIKSLTFEKEDRINKKVLYTNIAAFYFNKKDPDNGFKYIQKAIDLGYHLAFANLGCLYESGEFVEKNMEKAMELFRIGASKRSSLAQSRLGLYHYNRKENDLAIHWFRRASENCDINSMYFVALLLEKKDRDESKMWHERAGDNGKEESYIRLGELYEEDSDKNTALKYYLKAYELGSPKACYYLGKLSEEKSVDAGILFYKEGVERGSSESMTALGIIYMGNGLEKQATQLLEMASELGCIVAPYELGIYYLTKNREKSFCYLKKAYERGFRKI